MSAGTFDLTGSAVASAAGVATATLGPVPIGQEWVVRRTAVTSSSVALSTAAVYRNGVSDMNFLDRARGAGNGATSAIAYRLRSGESVVVQWTAADVGARCLVNVQGDLEVYQ